MKDNLRAKASEAAKFKVMTKRERKYHRRKKSHKVWFPLSVKAFPMAMSICRAVAGKKEISALLKYSRNESQE